VTLDVQDHTLKITHPYGLLSVVGYLISKPYFLKSSSLSLKKIYDFRFKETLFPLINPIHPINPLSTKEKPCTKPLRQRG